MVSFGPALAQRIGMNPYLPAGIQRDRYRLEPGEFLPGEPIEPGTFDGVCALAVLQHIPADRRVASDRGILDKLQAGGRAVLTVPSPRVDLILDVLMRLHLIYGMEAEQHHGFGVEEVLPLVESVGFELERHTQFQLALDNLFVFLRVDGSHSAPTAARVAPVPPGTDAR